MTFSLFASQTAECLWKFILYIIPCVAVLLLLHFFCNVPGFVFRKLLHFVAFSCVTLMIITSKSWEAASATALVLAAVIYPVLALFENKPWFAGLFVQKSDGEIKRSLLMLFIMFALLNAIAWGAFNKAYAGAAAIVMWGTGDAAAALIGIPFGKHKVISKLTDGNKSYEGTIAMFIVAFINGFIVLYFYAGLPLIRTLICAVVAADCGAVTELITPSEYDTVSVPLVILIILLILC